MVGNKTDLEESRMVTKEQGIKFKEDYGLDLFIETSAKTGYNTQEVLFEAAKIVYEIFNGYKSDSISIGLNSSILLDDPYSKNIEHKKSDESLNKNLINYKNPCDIILSFNSIKSLKEGWNLTFSDKGLKYFNERIKCPKVGILGNKRVGKSFILSKLFKLPEIHSPYYTNEQISIEIKEKNNKINYIIFDTQGFGLPILEEEKEEDKNDDIEGLSDSDLDMDDNIKKDDEININNNQNDNMEYYEKIDEFKKRKQLKELEINRKSSEEFIKKFIINCSDILIAVVGNLKHSEQMMLNNIMEESIKNKKEILYVIHNLQDLTTKEEVNDYIKNVLMKSGSFDLEGKNEIIIQDNSDSEEENQKSEEKEENNPIYYISKYKSLLTVYHLIYINDDSEEKSYNEFTKKMTNIYLNFCQRNKLIISESLKRTIYNLLKDYSINEEQIEITDIKDNEGKIIYKGNEDLNLINGPINLNNDIKLKYNYYISEENKKGKLLILIERPGNYVDIQIITKKNKNNMYIILYKGKKCLSEEEIKYKKNMKNEGREFGEFTLDIPIYLKDYEISNLKEPKNYEKNGLKKLILNLN